jgi:hypothetical protein|tara:strand:+ start:599 stop:793 length:195 start_codon:yes stop_codon:yes gene_type:complete
MTKSISDLVEKALKELIEENKIVIKNEDGETMDDLSIEYEDDTSWEDDDNEDDDNEDEDSKEDD